MDEEDSFLAELERGGKESCCLCGELGYHNGFVVYVKVLECDFMLVLLMDDDSFRRGEIPADRLHVGIHIYRRILMIQGKLVGFRT